MAACNSRTPTMALSALTHNRLGQNSPAAICAFVTARPLPSAKCGSDPQEIVASRYFSRLLPDYFLCWRRQIRRGVRDNRPAERTSLGSLAASGGLLARRPLSRVVPIPLTRRRRERR